MSYNHDTAGLIIHGAQVLLLALPAFLYGMRRPEMRRNMLVTFLAFLIIVPASMAIIFVAAVATGPMGGLAAGLLCMYLAIRILRKIWGGPISVYVADVPTSSKQERGLAILIVMVSLAIIISLIALIIILKVKFPDAI